MPIFNRQQEDCNRPTAKRLQPTETKFAQEVEVIIQYSDQTNDVIQITYNIEELQRLVSDSIRNGAALNFPNAQAPFSINTRWIKKVIYRVKEE